MPHIRLPAGVPGIRSLVLFRPDTGKHLYALAQVLLRGPSTLTEAERELIAAYVSSLNECGFCMNSHAAAARCLLADKQSQVNDVLSGNLSGMSDKMKQLMNIAAKVRVSGKAVNEEDIHQAKKEGATDLEIHDTVLIAATFSLFNRYVDGLQTLTPVSAGEYEEMGKRMVEKGYQPPLSTNTSDNGTH